jgi:quinol monooxygenase YgiN
MAIFQTGSYRVKKSAVPKVKKAIQEFVRYVKTTETGTLMYLAWQEKKDPTKFNHLFIFKDASAQKRHGESEAVKRFEAVYSPELVDGGVVFTDYDMIAGKREGDGAGKR